MRKLILQMQMSIDGFVGSEYGDVDWLVWGWGDDWNWDSKLRQYHIDTTASADCILLSDRMAQEGFIDHWGQMAERLQNPQSAFAANIKRAKKVVFSRKLEKSVWDNTIIAKGDLSAQVNELKKQSGKDILVFGGAGFVSSLIKADLVDEFHLIVNPAILGSGLSIFGGVQRVLKLSLIDANSYSDGIVVLRYKRRN